MVCRYAEDSCGSVATVGTEDAVAAVSSRLMQHDFSHDIVWA